MKINLSYYDEPLPQSEQKTTTVASSELGEFFNLLDQEDGEVLIRDNNLSVGTCFDQPLTISKLQTRRRITSLLYSGQIVPELIERLSDGRWSPKRLKTFLAGPVVVGRKGKGKNNNGERYGRR